MMDAFRLLARSAIHPGNLMLEDDNGNCYVYFGATGELSATAIDQSLASAMLQSYEWASIPDGEWMTIDQLHAQTTAPAVQSDPGTGLVEQEP